MVSGMPKYAQRFQITNHQHLWKRFCDYLFFFFIKVWHRWKLQSDPIILDGCGRTYSGLPKVLWNNKSTISSLPVIWSFSNLFVVILAYKLITYVWQGMRPFFLFSVHKPAYIDPEILFLWGFFAVWWDQNSILLILKINAIEQILIRRNVK